jgi:cytosine/adenosine deaminase-related metal-dependent hydrolase
MTATSTKNAAVPALTCPAGPRLVRIDAAALADAGGELVGPVSILVQLDPIPGLSRRVRAQLIASGKSSQIDAHPLAAKAERIDRSRCVLIPGLVNAHTHLDLTHIGPQPHDPSAGFAPWANMIRTRRHSDDHAIAESVALGVERSLAAGVVAVGDIAGAVRGQASAAASHALLASEINGVSFTEFFAVGPRSEANIDHAISIVRSVAQAAKSRAASSGGAASAIPGGVRAGLSPHAPYSVSPASYRRSIEALPDLPICTHLAESLDERRFIAQATGPLRSMLESIGVWDDGIAQAIGHARSPVAHIVQSLPWSVARRIIAVHLNDLSDADIALVSERLDGAIYCPRASAYFAADRDFGPHRYRELLSAGVRVALGTDSIVNLPDAASLGPWHEMKFLHARDQTDPITLLAMATFNGAKLLHLDADAFLLRTSPHQRPRTLAGIVAIEASGAIDLRSALVSTSSPELMVLGSV